MLHFYTCNRGEGRTIKSCSKSNIRRQGFAHVWYLPGDLSVQPNKPSMSIFICISSEVKRLLTPLHPQTPFQRIKYLWEHSSEKNLTVLVKSQAL